MKLPTVKIVFKGGFVIINRCDFDPAQHQLFDAAVRAPDLTPIEPPSLTRQPREAELLSLYFGESGDEANWRSIKKIADQHGIEKPVDGWDEAIPLILDAEFPKIAP